MGSRSLTDIRGLFAAEAEQRLSRLGQLTIELEQRPTDDATIIGEIFREVHTLKGAAAVVGFETVARYAHKVEGRLEELRSTSVVCTPTIADALLVAIDHLGTMITRSVAGDGDADDGVSASVLAMLATAFEPTDDLAGGGASAQNVADPVLAPTDAVPEVAARAQPPVVPPTTLPVRPAPHRDGGGTVMVPVERLDELVRMVGEAATGLLRVGRALSDRFDVQPDELSEIGELSRVLYDLQERAMRTLMVPVATITDQLHRAVRDAARVLGKEVRWEVRGEATELDRNILHQLSDSLLHLVRNAVDHGIESAKDRAAAGKPTHATVRMHAMQLGSEVIIAITDDGGGIDVERVRQRATRMGVDVSTLSDDDALQLVFRSGLSTAMFVSELSGRGVGLDVVRAHVEAARGRVEVRTTPGVGSEFRIIVPITLAVLHCLIVESAGQRFALPLHRVAQAQAVDTTSEVHVEGRRAVLLEGRPVPVSDLGEVIELHGNGTGSGTLVVVNGSIGRHAFEVQALVGQRDVVVKAMSPLVPRLDFVAGTSIEPDGSILLVLDPMALIERARRNGARSATESTAVDAPPPRGGRVLVVDDALTVRELQRAILERAGFDVRVARDGVEALELLEVEVADLVLTDVEMPRMDGFTLTTSIRERSAFSTIPVLILTSLSNDADRQRGMDAGADGYIVKSAFDEVGLLAAVDRVIGPVS